MKALPLGAVLAFRNLARNPRRTALSALGIGVGCAIALLFSSLMRGRDALVLKGAAENGIGHVLVAPQGWSESRDERLRLKEGEGLLARLKGQAGVLAAAPRIKVQALLSMGSRQLGLELKGVDPAAEPRVTRAVRRLAKGRYLEAGDKGTLVLGREAALRLNADLDDEIMATAVGPGGSLQNAMFRVVGLSDSGSPDADAGIAHVSLPDAAELSGSPGIGEIALLGSGPESVAGLKLGAKAALQGGDEALEWKEVASELKSHMDMDAGIYSLLKGVVMFLVFLGVAGAQLTAALERRREVAMLAALGVGPGRLARMILSEALALSLLGAAAGLVLAAPGLWYLVVPGIDLAKLMGQELNMAGMLIDSVFRGEAGLWLAKEALILALGATLLASLYPAWLVFRAEAAEALRGEP